MALSLQTQQTCVKTYKVVEGENGNVDTIGGISGTEGQQNGSQSTFTQPTGLAAEGHTVFVIDSAVGKLKVIVPVHGLLVFLEMLDEFGKVFGMHQKCEKPTKLSIGEAIESLKKVE